MTIYATWPVTLVDVELKGDGGAKKAAKNLQATLEQADAAGYDVMSIVPLNTTITAGSGGASQFALVVGVKREG